MLYRFAPGPQRRRWLGTVLFRTETGDMSMKFSTTAGALRDALSTARHATATTASFVAYSGVLLLVKKGQLAVIGSDGETTMSALLGVEDSTDGQALLPPRPLGNYLGTLDASTSITVTASEGADVEVRAGTHAPYKFRPVAATFPMPAPTKTAPTEVRLDRLGQALSAVKSSVPKESPGVQLVSSEEGLFLHSTDSYRLSRAHLPESGFGEFSGVLPLSVLDRVARSEVNQVSVDQKGRTLRFSGPGIIVSARLLSTAFPAIEGVVSNVPESRVSFPTADLRQALTRLAAIAEGEPLYCTIEQDQLQLTVSNVDLGSGEEIVHLSSPTSTPFKFAVKLNYLLDATNSHESDTLSLAWASATSPLFVLSESPFSVTTVVMPMRV